jgi:hypothetical protein
MQVEKIFPSTANNDYRGHWVALWMFFPITAVTIGRSLVHILRTDGGAQSIATIPLDQYPASAAAAVIGIFALWGGSQLLIGALYGVVLWRYRNLLPLMYLLFITEYVCRLLLSVSKPIETLGQAPGATANVVFPILGLALLALALRTAPRAGDAGSAQR